MRALLALLGMLFAAHLCTHMHHAPRMHASEDTCRAIAREGETWEDACERVYHVAPDSWDENGFDRAARGGDR